MYVGSAADAAGLQAQASAAAVALWGSGPPGREVIAHPVCKGKYQPWKAGVRQYGCFRHHAIRQANVQKYGLREGWVSFEQWPRPDDQPGITLPEHHGRARKRARAAEAASAASQEAASVECSTAGAENKQSKKPRVSTS
eukprot:COSAG02_NODE_192_length_29942_cov_34.627228_3_plen_140_part_00